MSLEEFTPSESSEGGAQSAEVSEKFKESLKRSSGGMKRTKKDEKKATKNDVLLAGFLVKIIIDKRYDSLLGSLFSCLHSGYPSNFILGIISLIHTDIHKKIRELSIKEISDCNYFSEIEIEFNDSNLDTQIKNRINVWVEDIIDIITIEYSSIMTEKLLDLIKNNNTISLFISKVFTFFLKEINITIGKNKALSISEFILSEVEKELKKLDIEKI